jgi:hypothetical protein
LAVWYRAEVPIPDLTKEGLLPPGVHAATIEEIECRFARLNHRACREKLWASFVDYLAKIKPIGIVQAVFVDGSFITSKTKPTDIDLVIELPQTSSPAVIQALQRPEFDSDLVKKQSSLHIFFSQPGASDWVDFFQEIKARDLVPLGLKPNARKGILRVTL